MNIATLRNMDDDEIKNYVESKASSPLVLELVKRIGRVDCDGCCDVQEKTDKDFLMELLEGFGLDSKRIDNVVIVDAMNGTIEVSFNDELDFRQMEVFE